MMTDEEIEAIDDIRYRNKHLYCDKTDFDFILNLIDKLQKELSKKDKAIDNIETYCRNQLAFQNRLVRSKEKITEFNNGRFDVCEEILYIIDTEEENDS